MKWLFINRIQKYRRAWMECILDELIFKIIYVLRIKLILEN